MLSLYFSCLVLVSNIQGLLSSPHDTPGVVAVSRGDVLIDKEREVSKLINAVAKDAKGSADCPADYPYAFKNGKSCCNSHLEWYYNEKDGEACNGNNIEFTSTCCEGKAVPCPGSSCLNAIRPYMTPPQVQDWYNKYLNLDKHDFRVYLTGKEIDACVANFNSYRRKHVDTPDVVWDATLAKGSDEWAQHMMWLYVSGSPNYLFHSTMNIRTWHKNKNIRGWQGENGYLHGGVYAGAEGKYTTGCADALAIWYNEIKLYDFKKSRSKSGRWEETGHFTCMIWDDVRRFGIGVALGPPVTNGVRKVIVFGRFSPGCNSNERSKHVKPLKG